MYLNLVRHTYNDSVTKNMPTNWLKGNYIDINLCRHILKKNWMKNAIKFLMRISSLNNTVETTIGKQTF